jgi:hypothetical protein
MSLRTVVVIMSKRSQLPALSAARWLLCSAAAVSFALLPFGPTSPASARPAKSGPVIACFHPKLDRYTAQAHPNRCILRGYRGKQVVEIPIKGMNWGHWGSNPTRAAYGEDRRNGKGVRVIAYRPIACDEGRTWYSRVTIVFPGDGSGFELRLPACDGPSVVG